MSSVEGGWSCSAYAQNGRVGGEQPGGMPDAAAGIEPARYPRVGAAYNGYAVLHGAERRHGKMLIGS